MRFFIVIAALLMIPAFAVVLEWRFQSGQREELQDLCRARLAQAGFDKVTLTMDHFDARLAGTCNDPADREKVQSLVTGIRGVRVNAGDNGIRVPAKLTAKIQGKQLFLSGWLPTEVQRKEVQALAKASRPDLEISGADIRVSSHVELGQEAEGGLPQVFAGLLESIRLPASLSITGDGHRYQMKGSLPAAALREAVVEAAEKSGRGLEIDASQLKAHEHVAGAPFAQGTALADFVRSFFNSPMPGSFQIDQRNGPQIKAYATAEMESEWMTLLRAVSGAARVNAEITRVPSIYHFPNYQPESMLEPGVAERLREIFRTQIVFFDSGSSKLKPDEEAKLGPLVEVMAAAGSDLHVIVAGYADVGGEPGTKGAAVQKARAEAVRSKLIRLGATTESLEALPFDAPRPAGAVTDDMRRLTRSVELLIK